MLRSTTAAMVGALVAALASPHAAGKRLVTETDLLQFTWIADPQISPDASRVVFVQVRVDGKQNRYDASLFVVSTAGTAPPRRLTSGLHDLSPRWSPDGKAIAFVRAVEKDGHYEPGQLYLLRTEGGEARPLTSLANGASDPAWSPDGRRIAFSSATRTGAPAAGGPEPERNGRTGASATSDVKVITRAEYRANGATDYLDPAQHTHLFAIDVPDAGGDPGPLRQLTDGDFDERGAVWAADSASVYFSSDRVAEPYYLPEDSDLYSVPASGGAMSRVASIDGTITNISPSPDGRRLAFIGTLHGDPVRSYSQPDLFVMDVRPGARPVNLTADYDYDIGGGIGGDQPAPRGQNPKPIIWSRDGSALVVVAAEHGSANLKRVDIATRRVEAVTEGPQTVEAYSADPQASSIAAAISTQTSVGDVFIVTPGAAARAKPITRVNDALFADIRQSEPEEFWYRSFDGRPIQAWILKPPDFDAGRTYPMILEIHGGPHAAFGNTYTHEFMWLAAKGYVVLFTNPRGSTSYGQEFGNVIQFRYPGDDYKDLMAGVDEVLKRGWVDSARLGVTGGSGGGLLTNWTITQTERFRAAVSQRDIADWYGFWFTADFSQFQPAWFHKAPWEDPQDFAARSPITYVGRVKTPLMLLLGDADYRTPPADGGEMMFRALKYLKVPTVMVRFPRENHELSRSGEPQHRIERLRQIAAWMDRWLRAA